MINILCNFILFLTFALILYGVEFVYRVLYTDYTYSHMFLLISNQMELIWC